MLSDKISDIPGRVYSTREIACPAVNHYWFYTHRHGRFGRG